MNDFSATDIEVYDLQKCCPEFSQVGSSLLGSPFFHLANAAPAWLC